MNIKTIVHDPRDLPNEPVAGLNEKPLRYLLEKIEKLSLERQKPPKAYLLTSAEPGYGKTFLIGRLIQEGRGLANFICIPPFENPERAWHSLLRKFIDEMLKPEYLLTDRHDYNSLPPAQLDMFIHLLFGNLLADVIKH
ncbi:hypothetical protein [Methylacidiphilum caldifontis]|nr:hypothetical protein [Methylacidiphilum caldifontis]